MVNAWLLSVKSRAAAPVSNPEVPPPIQPRSRGRGSRRRRHVAQPSSRPGQGRNRLRKGVARSLCLAACASIAAVPHGASAAKRPSVYRIDHVADGDTVTLRNGQRVRLVQIDTPEVYFRPECYGRQASRATKQLLPPGTLVRLLPEPA